MPVETNSAAKFRNLSRIARLIQDSHDPDELLVRLVEGVCLNSIWNFSSIQVLDQDSGKTIPIIRYNPFKTDTRAPPDSWDAADSPILSVVETGRPVVIRDAAEQDRYCGFRDDARQRGYHTVAFFPLKFPDRQGRALAFTVISHQIIDVDDEELAYLQCLADLADIAVRQMLRLAEEKEATGKSRQILRNLTTALAGSLNIGMSSGIFPLLGKLIPTRWFAIDLTTGSLLCDETTLGAEPSEALRQDLPALMRLARQSTSRKDSADVSFRLGSDEVRLRVQGLAIDGENVGALFLIAPEQVGAQEWVSVEAAHLALSTLILRNHMAFRSRSLVERRALQQLVSGSGDMTELLAEFRLLGITPEDPRRVLMMQASEGGLPGDMHSFILRKVEAMCGASLSLMEGNRLGLLVPEHPGLSDEKARAALLRQLQPAWHRPLSLTLSEPMTRLGDYADAWAGCRRVLDVGLAMKAEGWISGGKIGYFPRLMASLPETVAEAFLARTIEPLLDGGSEKGRTALLTLGTWLSTGRRLQETADQLGIHVSTLRYRLERFTERYGIDFEDSETCFDLEIAIRLYHLRHSYQKQ
ncbi:helix-turn-helix domain-containing protein [Rhodobacter sp. 24-YEA-8]|uniref:helix-turn-helix domain-containing protein n=1 Tax=Rhodobacter sp. 24-YEA-8 TaxID=1884310 RepID=UPI000895C440|nr:helix-turn-helix domain-containing protein [Rhodobacter sp. 24-YEA-8]SED73101.1 Sugar diacid utilization regulator [Rhodobacter sp. 24-YEA-8]